MEPGVRSELLHGLHRVPRRAPYEVGVGGEADRGAVVASLRELVLVVPAEAEHPSRRATEGLADPEVPAEKLAPPVVSEEAVELRVDPADPVQVDLGVHVLVHRPIVSHVLHRAPVAPGLAHDVVHAEPGRQDAAVPALPDVLREEREPEDGHISEIESHRPGDDDRAHDELHLVGREVIVRLLQVAGGEGAVTHPQGVPALQGRVAPDAPLAPHRVGAQHRAAPALRVIEQHAVRLDDLSLCVRQGHGRKRGHERRRVDVHHGVRVEPIAQPLHPRAPPQLDRPAPGVEADRLLRAILHRHVARPLEQRLHDRVDPWEADPQGVRPEGVGARPLRARWEGAPRGGAGWPQRVLGEAPARRRLLGGQRRGKPQRDRADEAQPAAPPHPPHPRAPTPRPAAGVPPPAAARARASQ